MRIRKFLFERKNFFKKFFVIVTNLSHILSVVRRLEYAIAPVVLIKIIKFVGSVQSNELDLLAKEPGEGGNKMNKLRKNDVMLDMVKGNVVKVVKVKGDEITFDNETTYNVETVKNCFRFIENNTPYEAPVVAIDAKGFIVDEQYVETGIMQPVAVLFTAPGVAVITTKGKGEKINLVSYNVETEKFCTIVESVDTAKVLFNDNGVVIYTVVTENERKMKNDKDEVEIVKDYSDHIYVLKDGKLIGEFSNLLLEKNPIKVIETNDEETKIFFERNKILHLFDDINGYEFGIPAKMDGVDLIAITINEILDEQGEVEDVYANARSSHYSSVTSISQVHGSDDIMVVTGSGIHIYGRQHMAIGQNVLATVAEFPILCRFTAAGNGHRHDTFVLANDAYETAAIRVKRVGGPVGYVTEITK